jgi:flagellar basal-body rod modification protein FlgD
MTTAIGSTDSRVALGTANAATTNLINDTQDRFLKLLVTSLQNQDPLNPMDNAQVTSQIAQLSTVQGITQLNNTLLALSGQMDISQSMQAVSLIGKDVLIPGDKISVGSGSATDFGADIVTDAAKVNITILDASGKAVRQFALNNEQPVETGVYAIEWDGKDNSGAVVPDGAYHVKVEAFDANGVAVASGALTAAKVNSVAYAANGMKLDLGLAGNIGLLDIRKVL